MSWYRTRDPGYDERMSRVDQQLDTEVDYRGSRRRPMMLVMVSLMVAFGSVIAWIAHWVITGAPS